MSSQLISELRKSLADVSEQLRTLAILGAQTKCCFKPQMDILTTRRETLTHEIEVEEEKEKKMMELKVFDATTEDAAYLRGFHEGRQKGFEEGEKSGFKGFFQDGFKEGHKKGLEEGGFNEGHKKGFEEGKNKGFMDGFERFGVKLEKLAESESESGSSEEEEEEETSSSEEEKAARDSVYVEEEEKDLLDRVLFAVVRKGASYGATPEMKALGLEVSNLLTKRMERIEKNRN